MSDILVTVECARDGESLCAACPPKNNNTFLWWQVRDALTGEPIGPPRINDPLFNAARILMASGADPDAMLYLVTKGETDASCWRLRGRLRNLAQLTTNDRTNGKKPIRIMRHQVWSTSGGIEPKELVSDDAPVEA